ncbi:MAG: hypothetical protein E7340_02135 [Clostridiales bacterium]|nr:hypothetical protein [Clostridiales bacterium]
MKKLLAILLAALTMFSALSLSACADNGDKGEGGATTNIVFNGFEDFDRDFLTIRVVDWAFGSVNQNFDKKYVKFGEASALFRPYGEIGYRGLPIIYLPMYSTRFEYNYKDMTKVEKISAWFYNAQEETYKVGIGLQTATVDCGQTLDSTSRTVTQKFNLVPGWNYVEYDMDPKYLNCQTGVDLTNIFGMCIQFEYCNELVEEAPYIYVDDIRFHLSEETVTGSETFGLKADAENGVWEVADFEDVRQAQMFTIGTEIAENRRCTIEVVNANELSTTAKSGQNVLKVTRHASYTTSHTYSTGISGDVLSEVFKTIGKDLVDHPENYVLKLDYFNYNPTRQRAGYNFGSSLCTRNCNTWRYLDYVEPYTWGSFEVNIGWCQSYLYGQLTSENPVSTYPKLLDGYTVEDAKFTTNPSTFGFSFAKYTNNDRRDMVFVFDNIRVERIA